MAKDKCKCEEGAPLWVLTFGDMMSLLLTFFILLAALSELKKEDEYKVIVEIVQQGFGMRGGGGKMELPTDPTLSLRERLEKIEMQQFVRKNVSNTEDPGMEGRQPEVTTVREGTLYAVGGKITFAPNSADLSEEARTQLRAVAKLIAGHNNKIEVRGHTSPGEVQDEPSRTRWQDQDTLAFARAKAAADYLASEAGGGIRAERLRMVAAGSFEPVRRQAYGPERNQPNRRVEIIVMEALVKAFQEPGQD